MKTHDENLKGELWEALIEFLERELRVQQQRCLLYGTGVKIDIKDDKSVYNFHFL